MNFIVTAVLATVCGLSWNWATGNQPMSYWLMGVFLIGSCAGADFIGWFLERRRARRRRVRRAAVVNSWRGRRKADQA